MLQFENAEVRDLADQLMQPALIRIIDNIRKQLEASNWKGDYQETQLWPAGTNEAQMRRVKELQAQLGTATPEEADTLRDELLSLPQPFPGYKLHLTLGDRERIVDVWELCCHVCFERFPIAEGPVTVDMSLIDLEFSELDWLALDTKAKSIVETVFNQLGA